MFDLNTGQILEIFHIAHLAGIAAGLGGAASGYALATRLLFAGDKGSMHFTLQRVHILVATGLGLLWCSGLAIAFLKFSLPTMPMKLVAKLILASLLLIDAFYVRRTLLPLFGSAPSPLLLHITWRNVITIVMCGSVSLTCWLLLLLLATFAPLQKLPPETLIFVVLLVWSTSALALLAIIGSGKLVHLFLRQRMSPRERWRLERTGRGADDLRAVATAWPAGHIKGVLGSLHARAQPILNRRSPPSRLGAKPQLVADGVVAAGISISAVPNSQISEERPGFAAAFAQCRSALTGIAGISIVTNILMLTGPLFMLQIYDRVLTSRSIPTLTALVVLVGSLFCFLGALELIRSRVLVRIGLRIDRILAKGVFQAAVRIAPATETLRTRALRDLEQLRQFIAGPGPAALFDMPWTPIYFALIFAFHWVLGTVALAGALVLIVFSLLNEFLSRKPVAEASRKSTRALALAEAGWRNAEALHAMGMFDRYFQRWYGEHRDGLARQTRANDLAGTFSTMTKVSRLFLQSLMLATGAYLAINQQITPGVIIAASIIMSRGLAPVEQAIAQWRGFIAARQGAHRIRAALQDLPDGAGRMSLPAADGFISVEKLYVTPPGGAEPVLKGLNFDLQPGDALAVVGANGSGKSTLARALVGVWPAQHGQVRLDGAALSQWLPEQLGAHIGYLPQDIELFDGTVAENIARFDPHADPKAIVAAARKAQVHDLVLRLPEGYATHVGEGGAVLSGGQRQRIALARVLYSNPVFVVLDEPNSNLDAEGESALAAAIHDLREQGSAVVIMAHRARTIAAANLVLVLQTGRQIAFDEKEKVLAPSVSAATGNIGRSNNVHPISQRVRA